MLPGALGANETQDSQTPHGPCAQFNDRARIRADDVFPQPRPREQVRVVDRLRQRHRQRRVDVSYAKLAGRYLR